MVYRGFRNAFIIAATASSLLCQTVVHHASRLPPKIEPLHLSGPGILAVDSQGTLYAAVSDGILKIGASGNRTRVAGIARRWSEADGAINPHGIAFDNIGDLYIADTGNHRIRKLALATGTLSTVAGTGTRGFSGDGGSAIAAELDGPTGLAFDPQGNLYVADGTVDGTNRIRKIGVNGVIFTVAGNGTQGFSGDGGPAASAQFHSLGGLATDAQGNLYIADNYNNRIRMVSATTGIVTTVASDLNNPLSVAADQSGNLFIADSGNFRVRRLSLSSGAIATAGNGDFAYRDAQHGYPCALAFDPQGNLYVADSGTSRIRRVPAASAMQAISERPSFTAHANPASNFHINVTYDSSVPQAAQTAFNSVIAIYENVFTLSETVNIDLAYGDTDLGESSTSEQLISYTSYRGAMISNANANPGNTYVVAAAASLPATDPIGNGTVLITTANARALGFNANTSVDCSITLNASALYEYNGVALTNAYDFMDVVTHEFDEGLAIGSALTGLADNATKPTGNYAAQDYFRYSAPNTRLITTDPNAVVYFSYDGGNTNVAQFNQSYAAAGASDLDRNDWIYGNFGCPSSPFYLQDAVTCSGQAVAVGSGPEITVLSAMGYDSSTAQTISFAALPNVTFGIAPFTVTATASSGLTVAFTSRTTPVCTVSNTTVTVIAAGTCTIAANQAGNATYSAAPTVNRGFTVGKASQTITFNPLPAVTNGAAPFTVSVAASSGLAVTLTSTTTAICTVSGTTVTIVTFGQCSLTASQTGNTNYLAATPVTQAFTVNPIVAPSGVSPASGTGATQTFTYTFTDQKGYADLNVLDVIVSTFLDGQTACYFALAPTSATTGYIYLVDDAGDGNYAPGTPMPLPSTGSLQNSQCRLNGTGTSISASGNTLTLKLSITFSPSFAGNKAMYVAARSMTQNSGWQSIGTWNVPGPTPAGPGVGTVSPARSTSSGGTYTFTFTDTGGFADLLVLDILTNGFLDGINACYMAYVPSGPTTGYVYLIDDAGDGGNAQGSPAQLASGIVLQNSQCSISTSGSSASASGNTLTLNLALTFKSTFAGNQVFFLAARNSGTGNSGWQAAGSVTVP